MRAHLLKYVLNPASYARMVADGFTPLTASDSQLSLYSDFYFEYDTQRRVTKETVLSGSQTYLYAYTQSTFTNGYNSWATKTVETLPNGDQNIVYSNYAAQTMLKVLQSGSDQWCDFYKYDSSAKLILHANPSAVSGFDDSHADLLNFNSLTGKYQYLKDNSGLIETNTHDPCSGYVANQSLQQGQLGTSIKLADYGYICCTASGSSSSSSSSSAKSSSSSSSSRSSSSSVSSSSSSACPCSSNIYYLAAMTQYPSDTNQTQKIVTSFAYTFYSGTCAVQQRVTTWPVISAAQNGSGVAATRSDYFDQYGNLTWQMDERGFITRLAYEIPTGGLSQRVDDVNTSMYTDTPSGWATPSGGGLNLVSDYLLDAQGRMTQKLLPTNTIDLQGTATTLRTAQWMYYDDPNHTTYSGQGYATGSSPSYTYFLMNPVSIVVMDASGKVLQVNQAVSSTTSGSLPAIITAAGGGAAAFPQSSYTRWTTIQYTDCCLTASRRVYKQIPASGSGSSGINFDQTTFGYDALKRLVQTTTPGGTITWNVLDPRGLLLAKYIGTNDTGGTYSDPTGGGTLGNNMVLVTTNVYDGGTAGGDGNQTQVIQHIDSTATRTTTITYDFRDRMVTTDGEIDNFSVTYYDNLDRIVKFERYNTTGPGGSSSSSSSSSGATNGNLIARNITNFDDRSRVYQSIVYGVDPTTGIVGNALTDNIWYDSSGNVVKSWPAGSQLFIKSVYDSLGRRTIQYSGYGTDSNYPAVLTVANNTIIGQTESIYDSANNVIQTNVRQRYHNAPVTQLGALQTPGVTPNARVTYLANYPDPIWRVVNSVNYGTNAGTTLTRPSTAPARSALSLVTSLSFDPSGNLATQTNPAGIVTCNSYDTAGRKTVVTTNCISSSSSSSSSSSVSGCQPSADVNITITTIYNFDGNVSKVTANNGSTGNQTTQYIYGSMQPSSSIASSLLKVGEIYPDSVGGSDQISFTYNRQQQVTTLTDQNGTVHSYVYDLLGRRTNDCITTLGTGVDNTVLQLATTYEVRGMKTHLTSYSSATVNSGTVVNDCQFVYNNFAQLVSDYQSHSGAVNTGATPCVQYGFANGSANTIRPTSITYPNGRVVNYTYSSSGSLPDSLSRVDSISDSSATLAQYSYLGLSTFVITNYSQPGIEHTLLGSSSGNSPAGDIYWGLDVFGRIIDSRWLNTNTTADVDRIKYGYDSNGNRLFRQNTVATADGANFDELYSYDRINRLRTMDRGQLNSNQTGITNTTFDQCWALDASGNWTGFRQDSTGNGVWDLIQSRAANTANEITAISAIAGPTWVAPVYNVTGDMTTMPQPAVPTSSYTATYDAWNRLMVIAASGTTVSTYAYDAAKRRVIQNS